MGLSSPDPDIPQERYDPDKPNAGIREMMRQQEFCEDLDSNRMWAELHKSHGKVFERGEWVIDVPHSSATWPGGFE